MNTTIAKNSAPVGFFDSGVGGVTVYSKFREVLPSENCLYFGDTVHNPYGEKTVEELIGYARSILDFFESKSVKAVVIACNTSSAVAYDVVKNDYDFKIYPIIQSCAKVVSQLPVKRLGVFATRATIKSGAYEKEIKRYNLNIEIFPQSCPGWVSIVENKAQNDIESIKLIESDMKQMLLNNPEKILLGCTHYPYLIDVLSQFAPRDLFIDPAVYFVDYIHQDLQSLELLNLSDTIGTEEFFVSSDPMHFQKSAGMFYELNATPQLCIQELV